MKTMISLTKKEALHIVRDPRTMFITLLMPLILLLLFGFAISTEVNSVRIVAVTDRYDQAVSDLLERFRVNEYFDFMGATTPEAADRLMKSGKIDAALFIRTDGGMPQYQIVVDASNTNSARAMAQYIQGVIQNGGGKSLVLTRILYNPQMKSSYNFVPGIMGMIFILICAIMTSVSIVREKENGTMNLLLVSPVKPGEIIIGKLVPYFLLSCVILAITLIITYTVLEVPLSESVGWVIMLSFLYILLALSVGLLVSTIVDSQLSALLVSAVAFMLPVIMLSGMIFPIDNMPLILQWISAAIPARWYIEAMRKLMIQHLGLMQIMKETLILTGMTAFLLIMSIKNFQKSSR